MSMSQELVVNLVAQAFVAGAFYAGVKAELRYIRREMAFHMKVFHRVEMGDEP